MKAQNSANAMKSASQRLQRALGLQDALPYNAPPVMPPNLVQAFEEGLEEFGIGVKMSKMDLSEGKGNEGGGLGVDLEGLMEPFSPEKSDVEVGEKTVGTPRSDAAPVLFPSPRIEQEEVFPEEPATTPANVDCFLETLFQRPPPATAPSVAVVPPTPHKIGEPPKGKDRKRTRADSRADHLLTRPVPGAFQQKKLRNDGVTGLQTLPVTASAAWTTDFPGRTDGLSHTLLTWHSTMSTLYQKCQDETVMQIHPLFPYPPTRPVGVPLVSISFWDTSVEPRRELRFIGPGDVSSILYAEVDTFSLSLPEDHDSDDVTPEEYRSTSGPFARMASGRIPLTATGLRKIAMHDRNAQGEGRWCFVVVNGWKKADGEVAPFVVLGWPTTSVTNSSECLYTIYPDEEENLQDEKDVYGGMPPPLLPASKTRVPLGRLVSMPTLWGGGSVTPRMRDELRSASATTLPPPAPNRPRGSAGQAGVAKGVYQPDAWTLRRTSLMFQKAGGVPLIEAFRTDAGAWMPFLEAVGKGKGKVMTFCEMD